MAKRVYAQRRSRSAPKKRMRRAIVPTIYTPKIRAPLLNSVKAYFRYTELNVQLNPTGGTPLAKYNFASNGMYDPNITGVGHQPMGFDQLMSLYRKYCVTKAKIRATFVNSDATNPLVVGICNSSEAGAIANLGTAIENGCNYKVISNTSAGGPAVVEVQLSVSPPKFLGLSSKDNDICGTYGANPGVVSYFDVFASALDGTSDVGYVVATVTIDYEAILSQPRDMSQS